MEVRWQLIRSFETAMNEQNENLMLRKQIDRLHVAHKAQNRVTGDKLKVFTNEFLSQLGKLREELVRTKKEYADGSLRTLREMDGLKAKLIDINHESQDRTMDIAQKMAENATLTDQVAELKREMSDAASIKAADADRNARTIEMLRAELGEADTVNKYSQEKIDNLEAQVKNEIVTRESLSEEVKRLRLWIGKMEENGLVVATEAEERKRRMELEHQMNVKAMAEENNSLRSTIVFLQEELSRAQAALNVPTTNSHFGKFVELKNENRKLTSKLENTMRAAVNAGPGAAPATTAAASRDPASEATGSVRSRAQGLRGKFVPEKSGTVSGAEASQRSPRVPPPLGGGHGHVEPHPPRGVVRISNNAKATV